MCIETAQGPFRLHQKVCATAGLRAYWLEEMKTQLPSGYLEAHSSNMVSQKAQQAVFVGSSRTGQQGNAILSTVEVLFYLLSAS
jgi:hypothetical protein